jgi:hypothetical protein
MTRSITATCCSSGVAFGLLTGAAFVLLAFLAESEIVREFGRRA